MSNRNTAAIERPAPLTGDELDGRGIAAALMGYRFPTFVLSIVTGFTVMLLAVLFVPPSKTAFGAFAESFKIWCYGYDPVRGTIQWGYVVGMVVPFVIFSVVTLGLWNQPLRMAWLHRRRAMALPAGMGLLLATVVAGALVVTGVSRAKANDPLNSPFPAEQLRTVLLPPTFELENQDGTRVRLEQFQGKVTLVTAVYASCGYTCPMIMAQTKKAVRSLSPEQQADLRVVAITLDPSHDDQKALAEMAKAQEISAPQFNLLTGPVQEVERVLDAFQVSRRFDPESKTIEHVNLHILLDRRGKIAYRLTVGERQQEWLMSALKLLIDEK